MRVTRVLAPNPGIRELEGTNSWIVGDAPAIVVENRSCSNISGSTSLEVVISTPSSSSSRISRMRCSLAELA